MLGSRPCPQHPIFERGVDMRSPLLCFFHTSPTYVAMTEHNSLYFYCICIWATLAFTHISNIVCVDILHSIPDDMPLHISIPPLPKSFILETLSTRRQFGETPIIPLCATPFQTRQPLFKTILVKLPSSSSAFRRLRHSHCLQPVWF